MMMVVAVVAGTDKAGAVGDPALGQHPVQRG
jgi:hypothetical protein